MSEISALFEDMLKTSGCLDGTVAVPIGNGSTVTTTLQELAMNRTYYVVGGLAALLFVFVVQAIGVIKSPTVSVGSQPVAASPASTAAPDATLVAIDDLAAWPAAAGR
jgi:hypothetical protein